MKHIINYIFLVLSGIVWAQENNYTITYLATYNIGVLTTAEDQLFINTKTNKSLYLLGSPNFTKREASPGEIIIYDTKVITRFYYLDSSKSLLYSKVKPLNADYFIKEPIPEMNWQLQDETKINTENILLHKAIISFRGRYYTAWYSTDYPIQVGPWKFNNLPGLAFEISEEDNQYHWQLTKIELNKFKVLPMKYDLSRANETLMSYLKNYQTEVESATIRMSKTISNIPGLEILDVSSDKDEFKNSRNMDLERKYEWEE